MSTGNDRRIMFSLGFRSVREAVLFFSKAVGLYATFAQGKPLPPKTRDYLDGQARPNQGGERQSGYHGPDYDERYGEGGDDLDIGRYRRGDEDLGSGLPR